MQFYIVFKSPCRISQGFFITKLAIRVHHISYNYKLNYNYYFYFYLCYYYYWLQSKEQSEISEQCPNCIHVFIILLAITKGKAQSKPEHLERTPDDKLKEMPHTRAQKS